MRKYLADPNNQRYVINRMEIAAFLFFAFALGAAVGSWLAVNAPI